MGLLMPALIVVLVGVGAGYGVGNFLQGSSVPEDAAKAPAGGAAEAAKAGEGAHGPAPKPEKEGEASQDQAATEEDEPIDPSDIGVTFLPPVVTNIADPQSVWVRLEGEITYRKSGEKKPDVLAPTVSEQIVNYLRTLKLSDLQGTDGIHFVSEDINNIVRSLNGGQVREVLITGLIVE